jgi:hypothetical protein
MPCKWFGRGGKRRLGDRALSSLERYGAVWSVALMTTN